MIPRPAMVLLVGVSGSGKSTFARKHFRKTEVLSSDVCRALLTDDEADQSATAAAFELLHWIAEQRLKRGKLVVVDATNVQAWARATLLKVAERCGAPAVAVVFDLPLAVSEARNRARKGRVVDAEVLAKQAADLAQSREELGAEGYAAVYMLGALEEIEGAEVSIG
ncbi:MAG: ATP-binding protein [Acidobacteriota bacterium]